MKRFLAVIFCIFSLMCTTYANDNLPPLRGAEMWFKQPKAGEKSNDPHWKVMLWRADKWRTSEQWRYYPHITSRYYRDCSYYKYVNCEDFRFCRCWQCRDYQYRWEYSD